MYLIYFECKLQISPLIADIRAAEKEVSVVSVFILNTSSENDQGQLSGKIAADYCIKLSNPRVVVIKNWKYFCWSSS